MYNLLIIDDEAAVVNGFAYDIDWRDLDIAEVYTSQSAQHALELLGRVRVDVVISDIRMPGLDGLAMTERIRQQWPFAKVILVSGHEEFEYAQQAIALGVLAYVTKPVPYDELKQIVRRALDAVEQELTQARRVNDAERQLREILPLRQERILNEWLVYNRLGPPDLPQALDSLAVGFDLRGPAVLLLVCLDERGAGRTRDQGLDELALGNQIRAILFRDASAAMFADRDGNYVAIAQPARRTDAAALLHYVDAMVAPLQQAIRRARGDVLSMFWDVAPSLELAPNLYRRLLDRSRRRLAWGPGVLMGHTEEPPAETLSLEALACYPPLATLIESLQLDQALQRIDAIFGELEARPAVAYELLLEVYHAIAAALIQASNKHETALASWAEDSLPLLSSFERIRSLTQLKAWAIDSIERYMSVTMGHESDHASRIVEHAKRLMIERLGEELSLTDLAAQLHLHPNYLSRLFKKVVGVAPLDYMIRLRVDRAKQLLEQPGVKVYAVAGEVGYNSVTHFNRIFKREVGLTPKEYQTVIAAPR